MMKVFNQYKLYIFISILILLPVFSTDYIPTEDGPLHLQTAHAYNKLKEHNPEFEKYYEINTEFNPNMSADLILAFFMRFFPVNTANKILLVIIIILFSISYIFYYRAFNKKAQLLLLLLVPFVYSYPFHLGFYNFLLGISLLFFTLAVYEKILQKFSYIYLVVYVVFSQGVILSHIVPSVLLIIYIFSDYIYGLFEKTVQNNRFTFCYFKELKVRNVLMLFLIPSIVLISYFIHSNENQGIRLFEYLQFKVFHFITMSSLYSFHKIEFLISSLLSVMMILSASIIIIKRIKYFTCLTKIDKLPFIALVFLIVYLAVPSVFAGGSMLLERLSLIPFMLIIPWISFFSKDNKMIRFINSILPALILAFTLSIVYAYRAFEPEFDKLVEVSHKIKTNSTILFLSPCQFGTDNNKSISLRIAPLMNAEGIISANSGAIGLTNLIAETNYGIIKYKIQKTPFWNLHTDDYYWSSIRNIFGYNQLPDANVDYFILYNKSKFTDLSNETGFLRELPNFNLSNWSDTYNPVRDHYENIDSVLRHYEKNDISLFKKKGLNK